MAAKKSDTSRGDDISRVPRGFMRRVLDGMFHTRRMFGGGLSQAWTSAAVALHYVDGFEDRFGKLSG